MGKGKRVPVVFSFAFSKVDEDEYLRNRNVLRVCFVDDLDAITDPIQGYFTDEMIDEALLSHRELVMKEIIRGIVKEGIVDHPYGAYKTIAHLLIKQHKK